MRPAVWSPPVEPSAGGADGDGSGQAGQDVRVPAREAARGVRRGVPAGAGRDVRGRRAQLAFATILQAQTGASDAEAIVPTGVGLESPFWCINEYHLGLKQCCGRERYQVRSAHGQRALFGISLRVFLRQEANRLNTGTS